MITMPRVDAAGDTVTTCGALTNSTDQLDATPINMLLPNATIGPILSIRALQF